jgi:Flp pilus assembly protein TadD
MRSWSFPAPKERLRQLLPIPAESLTKKVALTMGLAYFPNLGRVCICRYPADFSQTIAEIRRQLRRNPNDASLYVAMGNLYRMQGEAKCSAGAYAEAQTLFRRQIAKRPADGLLLLQYGILLTEMGKSGQAEGALRNALSLLPGDWRTWAALGQCLTLQAQALLPSPSQRTPDAGQSPATREQAWSTLIEARGLFDRAVALAPNEPQVYLDRAEFYKSDTGQPAGVEVPERALADYRRAAASNRADPYTIALAIWEDLTGFAASHHLQSLATPDIAGQMPPQSRQAAAAAIARLRLVSKSSDLHLAARALMALAWIQYEFYGQAPQAEGTLFAALASDPSLDEAADYLLHIMSFQRDFRGMAAVCQTRLLRRNSARLHIIEAYALYKEGNLRLAVAQAKEACDLQPGDLDDLMILSWVRVKDAHDAAGPARAAASITVAGKYLAGATQDEREEYDLLASVDDFLLNRPQKARLEANQALALEPGNPPAVQLKMLLNESRPVDQGQAQTIP